MEEEISVRQRVRTPVGERSRTKQSFKEECDVNFIVKNHASGMVVQHLNPKAPTFGDYSVSADLKESIDQVNDANAEFAELPSAVRRAAGNSPVQLLAMLEDPAGVADLQEAGLQLEGFVAEDRTPVEPEPEVPAPVEIVDPE